MELIKTQYFKFEEDFVEDGIRCIPMTVRLKLDLCGVKLMLSEWSKLSTEDRRRLAEDKTFTKEQVIAYRTYLISLIERRTRQKATLLDVPKQFTWQTTCSIPDILIEKLKEFDWKISEKQWAGLSDLQRFALLKLCRPGHENRNFPIAFAEFGLIEQTN